VGVFWGVGGTGGECLGDGWGVVSGEGVLSVGWIGGTWYTVDVDGVLF